MEVEEGGYHQQNQLSELGSYTDRSVSFTSEMLILIRAFRAILAALV